MKRLYQYLALFVCTTLLSNVGWGQCFSPATNFSVQGFGSDMAPRSVVITDLNADGKLDLITANAGSMAISVLLGTGNGTFTSGASYRVDVSPVSLAVGDFNKDSKPDVVVANAGSSSLCILLGNGQGGFGNLTRIPLNNAPQSVVVGDFNTDGYPDLATANINPNRMPPSISVLLNNGQGGFTAQPDILNYGGYSLAVADINGDGKPDLVTTRENTTIAGIIGPTVAVLPGDGTGGFGPSVNVDVAYSFTSMVVNDFNGDGRPDLAMVNDITTKIYVLLNNGAGGLSPATEYSTGPVGTIPYAITSADFNADGKPDLAVTYSVHTSTTSIFLNNGLGTFSPPVSFLIDPDRRSFFSVAAGDFNADGKPDLVTTNQEGHSVAVLLNCTNANLSLLPPFYDCATGQLTLSVTGGTGTAVEYRIAGLRDWAPGNTFVVPPYQRTGTSFTLEARQSGQLATRTIATACASTPPFDLNLTWGTPIYDCISGQLTISTNGGNGSRIEYRIAGIADWSINNRFSIPTYQRNNGTTFTLEARQIGQLISQPFLATCQATPPPTPPSVTPLSLTAQSVNCQTGVLQLITSGGDGTVVEYKVPGLSDYSTSPLFTVPVYQRSNTSFTLYARQSGREVTSVYLASCPLSTRLASAESAASLEVVVYPNPVSEQFRVGVEGAAGQDVRFQLTNLNGQMLVDLHTQVTSDTHTETLRFPASSSGLYLLQVSTTSQRKTVKVIKP